MVSIRDNCPEIIWTILQELINSEFDNFKWFLKQSHYGEGVSGIPAARLEQAERQDIVDLMIQKYQEPGAVKVSLAILEKINRNDLKQNLSHAWSRLQDLKNRSAIGPRDNFERLKAAEGAAVEEMIKEIRMKIRAFTVSLQSVEESLVSLVKAINETRETVQRKADKYIRELEKELSKLEEEKDHANVSKAY